jgi:PadR family transcriptional regulator, regulatory protein PadR
VITSRTAILQALRQGPGYGRQLMRRVEAVTGRRASLAPGSVYPTLKVLEAARLVRKWTVIAGRARGGRARTYYELTVAGIREAEVEAAALAGLALAGRLPRQVSAVERSLLRDRAERVAALFAFAAEARDSLARARRRV